MRDAVVIAGHPFDHREVAAGRECLARTGDHRDPHGRILSDVEPDRRKLGVHLLVGGVVLLRPVKGNEQDAVVAPLERQLLVVLEAHADSCSSVVPASA